MLGSMDRTQGLDELPEAGSIARPLGMSRVNGNAHRWRTARRAAVLLCLSASTACTQGPDYERPVVAVPRTIGSTSPLWRHPASSTGRPGGKASATNTLTG